MTRAMRQRCNPQLPSSIVPAFSSGVLEASPFSADHDRQKNLHRTLKKWIVQRGDDFRVACGRRRGSKTPRRDSGIDADLGEGNVRVVHQDSPDKYTVVDTVVGLKLEARRGPVDFLL